MTKHWLSGVALLAALAFSGAASAQIKMGVAGDKYFEVLSGLKAGEQVITGPYNSVRGMADGDLIKIDNSKKK